MRRTLDIAVRVGCVIADLVLTVVIVVLGICPLTMWSTRIWGAPIPLRDAARWRAWSSSYEIRSLRRRRAALTDLRPKGDPA